MGNPKGDELFGSDEVGKSFAPKPNSLLPKNVRERRRKNLENDFFYTVGSYEKYVEINLIKRYFCPLVDVSTFLFSVLTH